MKIPANWSRRLGLGLLGVLLIVALAVSLLIVDLVYPLIDPRIRYQK